jgi:hypothetical protein
MALIGESTFSLQSSSRCKPYYQDRRSSPSCPLCHYDHIHPQFGASRRRNRRQSHRTSWCTCVLWSSPALDLEVKYCDEHSLRFCAFGHGPSLFDLPENGQTAVEYPRDSMGMTELHVYANFVLNYRYRFVVFPSRIWVWNSI